jgi:hypothetical protein
MLGRPALDGAGSTRGALAYYRRRDAKSESFFAVRITG